MAFEPERMISLMGSFDSGVSGRIVRASYELDEKDKVRLSHG